MKFFIFNEFCLSSRRAQTLTKLNPRKAHVMRNRLIFALALLLMISAQVQAQSRACTREYMPVCGQLGQEIKTFPTRCVMLSQGGTWLSDGACTPRETPTSEEIILTVAADDVACVGVVPMRCLRVKRGQSGEWNNFYDSIDGFTFKRGTTYQLLVRATPIPNPPADGSNTHYTLVRVLSMH
jgi:hypothetical protein